MGEKGADRNKSMGTNVKGSVKEVQQIDADTALSYGPYQVTFTNPQRKADRQLDASAGEAGIGVEGSRDDLFSAGVAAAACDRERQQSAAACERQQHEQVAWNERGWLFQPRLELLRALPRQNGTCVEGGYRGNKNSASPRTI